MEEILDCDCYNNDLLKHDYEDDVIYDHQLDNGKGWVCVACLCGDGCECVDQELDNWESKKLCEYAGEVCHDNYYFHLGNDIIEQCEREEQIKKIFNKLISVDVEHISNHIFSFIG